MERRRYRILPSNFLDNVAWGNIGEESQHIGTLRSNPDIIVRSEMRLPGNTELDEIEQALDIGADEHNRLRSCGVSVPIYAAFLCRIQNRGRDYWEVGSTVGRIFGAEASTADPRCTLPLLKLGRSLLKYYDTTAIGQPYLVNVAGIHQYTYGQKISQTFGPRMWLHNLTPSLQIRGDDNENSKNDLGASVSNVREWLTDIPDHFEAEPVIAYADEVYQRLV